MRAELICLFFLIMEYGFCDDHLSRFVIRLLKKSNDSHSSLLPAETGTLQLVHLLTSLNCLQESVTIVYKGKFYCTLVEDVIQSFLVCFMDLVKGKTGLKIIDVL